MSCYRKSNGRIESNIPNLTPCGNARAGAAQACCSAGDICMSNSICHYNEPSDGGSGYYLAGCTDPNFKDPACLAACVDLPYQDVVFNFTSNLWECCGNQHACGAPVSNETFQALPPAQLQVISTAAPNAAAEAAAAATATPSASPALSIGAAIGIGVACMTVFVVFAAIFAWRIVVCARRRREVRRSLQQPTHHFNSFGGYEIGRAPSEVSADSRYAFLEKYPRVYHVDGGAKRELEG